MAPLHAWEWGRGCRRRGVCSYLLAPPGPSARPHPRPPQQDHPKDLLSPGPVWEPHSPIPRPLTECSLGGRGLAAPGPPVQAATTAATSDQQAQKVADGAERGDPRGSRSGGSDLMVTLRDAVRGAEPGSSPAPSARGTAGCLAPGSAKGGQPPSPSYVQESPPPGHSKAVSP